MQPLHSPVWQRPLSAMPRAPGGHISARSYLGPRRSTSSAANSGSRTACASSHPTRAPRHCFHLADMLARTRGIRLEVADAPPASAGVRLVLGGHAGPSAESYELDVTPAGIEIRAADPRGLFYGAVTLWQLATAKPRTRRGEYSGAAHVRCAALARRGLMLVPRATTSRPTSSSGSSMPWHCTSSTSSTGT